MLLVGRELCIFPVTSTANHSVYLFTTRSLRAFRTLSQGCCKGSVCHNRPRLSCGHPQTNPARLQPEVASDRARGRVSCPKACPWFPARPHAPPPSPRLPCYSSLAPPVSLGPRQRVWTFWKPPLCLLSLPLYTPWPCGEIWDIMSALARGIKGFPRATVRKNPERWRCKGRGRVLRIAVVHTRVWEQEKREDGG